MHRRRYVSIGVRPIWFDDFSEIPGLIRSSGVVARRPGRTGCSLTCRRGFAVTGRADSTSQAKRADRPPSTSSSVAVMYFASSEARKSAA
jgi:hypothetical protein